MKAPLVSIILSTYNGSKYIKESIISVLNQSYSNFELIIINDSSIDNVGEIILDYQKKDNRIVYIKNKENLRLTKSLNKGLKLAKGKYIARIDDDDIWMKTKLQKQVTFMEKNNDYGLCGTSTIIINSEGKEIQKIRMRQHNDEITNSILKSNQFIHSSVIIRKSVLDKVGGYYNSKWNGTEDYELWLRIGKISNFYNIPEYLIKYRWLKTSISRKNQSIQQLNSIKLCFNNKDYYNNFNLSILYKLSFYIVTKVFSEKLIKNILWKLKNK